jgi:hypothetical protein
MKRYFKVSKCHANSFSIFWAFKKAVSIVQEIIFEVGDLSSEFIICLLDVLKNDFAEVDEAMFEGFEKPCEPIFGILSIQKATPMNSLK